MRALFYIVVCLVLAGCGYSGSSQVKLLDEAEGLMLVDPEEAMSKLNEMDVAQLRDSAVMARWALLYSEGMVASGLVAPTDTIINIALDYYSAHNRDNEFRRASAIKQLLVAEGRRDELATALYLQKEKEYMLYRERVKRDRYIAVGLATLLMACGIIVWLRQRVRLITARHEAVIAEASALRDNLLQKQANFEAIASKLRSTLDRRFAVIDDLCQTYYESQGTKVERKAIIDKIKGHIDDLQHDGELFAEMERSVNECGDGVLDHIRREMPAMKPEEYRLMVYLACRLSNRTIALLLGEGMEVVYKRKSRLKAKLTSNPALEPLRGMIL